MGASQMFRVFSSIGQYDWTLVLLAGLACLLVGLGGIRLARQQRKAERDRDRTRAFLDTIVDNVPATLVVKNVSDRRYVLINRAGENFFGLPREEMIGKTSHEVFSKAQADVIAQRDEELLASSTEIFVNDHPLKTPRNGTRLITNKKVTIRDGDGTP